MPDRPASPRRSSEQAWLITGPLAMLAVVLTVALGVLEHDPLRNWPFAIGLLGLVLLAERPMLQIVIRRQATVISFTEISLLFALYLLPPLTVAVVFTLSALITNLRRRSVPTKLWFNVARAAAAVSVAGLVLLALPDMRGFGPGTWAILTAAVGSHSLVTLAAVAAVFAAMHGAQAGWETIRTSGPGMVTVAINVAVGLVVVICLRATWWSALLLLALGGAVLLLYGSYGQFFRQHRALADVYELTKAMSESSQDGTLADALLGRARALMRAEYATLWLPAQGRHPEVLLTARVDDPGLLDLSRTPVAVRQSAHDQGRTVAVGSRLGGDLALREALREAHVNEVIVTPLRSGQAVIGSLEVVNRIGGRPIGHFTPADVPIFETIAAHAAVALENSRLVDRLRYDAYHDGLTNLANRRRVTAALEEAVRARAPGEVVAVLLFDVDSLRQVNESVGHAAGDRVLVEVANRLRSSAPSAALVGRIGSDEFVVTLRLESVDAALALAAEIRDQLRDQMVFDALVLDVDTAVGVAVHPDHGADAAVLLQRADLAVTMAKSAPDSIQPFSPGMESRSSRRLGLAGDLRRALDHAEVEVYYQPKVTLTDRRLVGVECLARWEHPAHGAVAPEDFVAVAEHTGQLDRLTELVLGEALRRSRDWSIGRDPLPVAVNLSVRTLADQRFPIRVQELLTEYDVAPELLTFEIKEVGVLDGTERAVPGLRRLRDIGVRLAVDDFGTGHSSLSYLRRLPVNEVKVDQSFVQGMATDPVDLAIVNAVVTLSQQFGLAVVAEGVESELTLELLQDIGCQIGQGYLFSRPLPYERLEAWFGAQMESEAHPPGDVRRLRAVP
ncbi:putative bifunctional diguanylate cyclase/phosphodiesterase [Plantactinospora sp. CA-290183]|uniref:putative bifunctional diguanylate cyclase/phosphodiesterase n=1 Tax=Plantactinospora sp. CA-290183 TaxID=3240006 RepID=UPI003D8B9C09